ncbi:CHAP domain-containing protein [Streptococcus intermedius]|uniref:CHAP domain-containing protein n=1 Tax=Streptococcus intermedius TaxID=1338 RepID=UPI000E3DFF52|nr:CHAP domain-containing protein [Streptococcus intermedius]
MVVNKKILWGAVAIGGGGMVFSLILVSLVAGVSQNSASSACVHGEAGSPTLSPTEGGQAYPSIEEFVRQHKEAYLLSWKAGGFLPSASIAQTMVENGFNFTNPNGTSFWQAHNMGGVKTSSKSNFPITLATYGEDSVDLTGTKPGTNVGDNTGGAYTWFKDYNAGIVGKAEFMAHQSLYLGAINNTNGPSALMAIFQGGWATDPNYLASLLAAYEQVGRQFQWLDQEAIAKYGNQPYDGGGQAGTIQLPSLPLLDDCGVGGEVLATTGSNAAPTLEIPPEYKGKLPFPEPDNQNYAGNNYPFGQCTWGAYNRLAQIGKPIQWFPGDAGNGGMWYTAAESAGYKVTKGKASLGDAACFPPGVVGSDPTYGHIAVVEYVHSDGSILISEVNAVASGTGTRSWRVLSAAEAAQLYFIEGRG